MTTAEVPSHICPRRAESSFGRATGADTWGNDDTCSWCGSLNPDILMARLEAADIEIGPTDKSYKIYVRNIGGALFKQTFRDCFEKPWAGARKKPECTGPGDCTHWTTRETSETKFYLQHLSPEQRTRFIDLYNEKRMKLGYPGYFYVRPFFCE